MHDKRIELRRGHSMSQQIVCRACGKVLRKIAGVHSAHEPPRVVDERGPLIRCPVCGQDHRYDGEAAADGANGASAGRPASGS